MLPPGFPSTSAHSSCGNRSYILSIHDSVHLIPGAQDDVLPNQYCLIPIVHLRTINVSSMILCSKQPCVQDDLMLRLTSSSGQPGKHQARYEHIVMNTRSPFIISFKRELPLTVVWLYTRAYNWMANALCFSRFFIRKENTFFQCMQVSACTKFQAVYI